MFGHLCLGRDELSDGGKPWNKHSNLLMAKQTYNDAYIHISHPTYPRRTYQMQYLGTQTLHSFIELTPFLTLTMQLLIFFLHQSQQHSNESLAKASRPCIFSSIRD